MPKKKKPLSPVTESLRRRDALIRHRNRCRKLVNECPKCALLRLHEDLADLRYAVKHCQDAGVRPEEMFAVMVGVIHGGV